MLTEYFRGRRLWRWLFHRHQKQSDRAEPVETMALFLEWEVRVTHCHLLSTATVHWSKGGACASSFTAWVASGRSLLTRYDYIKCIVSI